MRGTLLINARMTITISLNYVWISFFSPVCRMQKISRLAWHLRRRSFLCSFYLLLLFSRSVVSDFATPRTAALQAFLSITISQGLLKLLSIKSVMPSNHLILCHPLLLLPSVFPNIRVFSNEWLFTSGNQSIGASASASVLPMNIANRKIFIM